MAEKTQRTHCFIDVEIGGNSAGRIVLELFSDICPKTCGNFVKLCNGEDVNGEFVTYKGEKFTVLSNAVQIECSSLSNDAHEILVKRFFPEEVSVLKHFKELLLSTANRGNEASGLRWIITTASTPELDSTHLVFGRVVSGQGVVQQIHASETKSLTHLHGEARVGNCGKSRPRAQDQRKPPLRYTNLSSDTSDDEFNLSPSKLLDDNWTKTVNQAALFRRTNKLSRIVTSTSSNCERKIKGRGTVRYHALSSKSRSESETPPHWRTELNKVKPLRKEEAMEDRWIKGDKLDDDNELSQRKSERHSRRNDCGSVGSEKSRRRGKKNQSYEYGTDEEHLEHRHRKHKQLSNEEDSCRSRRRSRQYSKSDEYDSSPQWSDRKKYHSRRRSNSESSRRPGSGKMKTCSRSDEFMSNESSRGSSLQSRKYSWNYESDAGSERAEKRSKRYSKRRKYTSDEDNNHRMSKKYKRLSSRESDHKRNNSSPRRSESCSRKYKYSSEESTSKRSFSSSKRFSRTGESETDAESKMTSRSRSSQYSSCKTTCKSQRTRQKKGKHVEKSTRNLSEIYDNKLLSSEKDKLTILKESCGREDHMEIVIESSEEDLADPQRKKLKPSESDVDKDVKSTGTNSMKDRQFTVIEGQDRRLYQTCKSKLNKNKKHILTEKSQDIFGSSEISQRSKRHNLNTKSDNKNNLDEVGSISERNMVSKGSMLMSDGGYWNWSTNEVKKIHLEKLSRKINLLHKSEKADSKHSGSSCDHELVKRDDFDQRQRSHLKYNSKEPSPYLFSQSPKNFKQSTSPSRSISSQSSAAHSKSNLSCRRSCSSPESHEHRQHRRSRSQSHSRSSTSRSTSRLPSGRSEKRYYRSCSYSSRSSQGTKRRRYASSDLSLSSRSRRSQSRQRSESDSRAQDVTSFSCLRSEKRKVPAGTKALAASSSIVSLPVQSVGGSLNIVGENLSESPPPSRWKPGQKPWKPNKVKPAISSTKSFAENLKISSHDLSTKLSVSADKIDDSNQKFSQAVQESHHSSRRREIEGSKGERDQKHRSRRHSSSLESASTNYSDRETLSGCEETNRNSCSSSRNDLFRNRFDSHKRTNDSYRRSRSHSSRKSMTESERVRDTQSSSSRSSRCVSDNSKSIRNNHMLSDRSEGVKNRSKDHRRSDSCDSNESSGSGGNRTESSECRNDGEYYDKLAPAKNMSVHGNKSLKHSRRRQTRSNCDISVTSSNGFSKSQDECKSIKSEKSPKSPENKRRKHKKAVQAFHWEPPLEPEYISSSAEGENSETVNPNQVSIRKNRRRKGVNNGCTRESICENPNNEEDQRSKDGICLSAEVLCKETFTVSQSENDTASSDWKQKIVVKSLKDETLKVENIDPGDAGCVLNERLQFPDSVQNQNMDVLAINQDVTVKQDETNSQVFDTRREDHIFSKSEKSLFVNVRSEYADDMNKEDQSDESKSESISKIFLHGEAKGGSQDMDQTNCVKSTQLGSTASVSDSSETVCQEAHKTEYADGLHARASVSLTDSSIYESDNAACGEEACGKSGTSAVLKSLSESQLATKDIQAKPEPVKLTKPSDNRLLSKKLNFKWKPRVWPQSSGSTSFNVVQINSPDSPPVPLELVPHTASDEKNDSVNMSLSSTVEEDKSLGHKKDSKEMPSKLTLVSETELSKEARQSGSLSPEFFPERQNTSVEQLSSSGSSSKSFKRSVSSSSQDLEKRSLSERSSSRERYSQSSDSHSVKRYSVSSETSSNESWKHYNQSGHKSRKSSRFSGSRSHSKSNSRSLSYASRQHTVSCERSRTRSRSRSMTRSWSRHRTKRVLARSRSQRRRSTRRSRSRRRSRSGTRRRSRSGSSRTRSRSRSRTRRWRRSRTARSRTRSLSRTRSRSRTSSWTRRRSHGRDWSSVSSYERDSRSRSRSSHTSCSSD